MTRKRIFVTGMGMISPLGSDVPNTLQALSISRSGLKPLTRFPAPCLLPVGEIPAGTPPAEPMPATHRYALAAACEAVKGQSGPPETVIVGTTTGGMPLTEERLRQGVTDPAAYRYHATSSIAETIAQKLNCRGPAWTISNACSSGAAALALALELLRSGRFQRVLAGGADALCRLTYFGFSSLQVLDPRGGHPFDLSRKGLSLGEGAAMLFLVAAECPPEGALVELAGAGLSCDAWHPSSPQPEGAGARKAMANALGDAGISREEVDHVNLHGTGTPDNDSAEAQALRELFGENVPPIASVKGAMGHSLAAAGAMEAVISVATILSGRIPPTVGFEVPDPDLSLSPSSDSVKTAVNTVLSNSFGFGGNNAALVFRHLEFPGRHRAGDRVRSFSILGEACLTGVGDLAETLSALEEGRSCSGQQDTAKFSRSLDGRAIRRLKRLPRMVLSLAKSACPDRVSGNQPSSVFFGTGWGPLSETHDFLARLFESGDRFSSPFDFVGSVHNAPAGQVGMAFQATGPNLTLTGGEAAFEQALASAALLAPGGEETLLVVGADEYSPAWTPLFDRSAIVGPPSDGGGALWLKRAASNEGLRILPVFLGSGERNDRVVENLADCLVRGKEFCRRIGAVLVGLPAAQYREGWQQLKEFLDRTGFSGPVLDYRKVIGEFASASAVATVLGVSFLREGEIPAALNEGQAFPLNGRGILVLGLGSEVSAVGILG